MILCEEVHNGIEIAFKPSVIKQLACLGPLLWIGGKHKTESFEAGLGHFKIWKVRQILQDVLDVTNLVLPENFLVCLSTEQIAASQ